MWEKLLSMTKLKLHKCSHGPLLKAKENGDLSTTEASKKFSCPLLRYCQIDEDAKKRQVYCRVEFWWRPLIMHLGTSTSDRKVLVLNDIIFNMENLRPILEVVWWLSGREDYAMSCANCHAFCPGGEDGNRFRMWSPREICVDNQSQMHQNAPYLPTSENLLLFSRKLRFIRNWKNISLIFTTRLQLD